MVMQSGGAIDFDDEEDDSDSILPGGNYVSEAERLASSAQGPKTRSDGKPIGADKGKRVRVLTESQKGFLDGIIGGKPQRQAYRDAYPNDNSSDGAVSAAAYRLTQHPLIKRALLEQWEHQAENLVDDAQATKRWVTRQLLHCATELKQEGSKLKALEMLGRISGAFTQVEAVAVAQVSAAQLKRELAGHLTLLDSVRLPVRVNKGKAQDAVMVLPAGRA